MQLPPKPYRNSALTRELNPTVMQLPPNPSRPHGSMIFRGLVHALVQSLVSRPHGSLIFRVKESAHGLFSLEA
jgi:hypothetical protein